MNNYIVTIDKIERPFCSTSKAIEGVKLLRFDVSCSLAFPDTNNNLKETSGQILGSFEVLQEGIKTIRVSPIIEETFKVEYSKGSGPTPAKSVSVHVIHRRIGKFSDSNENIALVQVPPDQNLIADEPARMSTFDVSKQSESNRQDGLIADINSLKDELLINETDLQTYSKFTFKFSPLVIPEIRDEGDSSTTDPPDVFNAMPNLDALVIGDTAGLKSNEISEIETNCDTTRESDEVVSEPIQNPSPENLGVTFTSTFDSKIAVSIELHNLIFYKEAQKSIPGGENNPQNKLSDEKGWQGFYAGRENKPIKFKDLKDIARAQANYEKELSKIPSKSIPQATPQIAKASTTIRFIKAMVLQRLQSLGMQLLECHEIVDAWENRQLKTNWYLNQDGDPGHIDAKDFNESASPYVSKPNSSLFRLSPSGHISGSIFNTFVHQVEVLKGIISNATCTLVQTSVSLLLPEIKLLFGRQLETNNNPTFIHEWVRLLMLAAKQLKPVAPEDISLMVNRELKNLKTLSHKLHTVMKKIHHKIEKISQFSEENFRKALYQFHPKSLKDLDTFSLNLKKKHSPDVIHYDPTKLHKLSIDSSAIFKDHVFFSETNTGDLLVKNDIDGFWIKFQDLEFDDRRTIFLALTGDLSSNLRSSLNAIKHLQEIYTEGYPGSIKDILEDIVGELKFTSKRDDLTVLMKTSLVTNISYLYELLTRLLFISEEVDGITKSFNKLLRTTRFNATHLKNKFKKEQKKISTSSDSNQEWPAWALQGYNKHYEAGIQYSNAQLAIPFSHADALTTFKNSNA